MALHTRQLIAVPPIPDTCPDCRRVCERWTPGGLRCADCLRFIVPRLFQHLRYPNAVCPFDHCFFHDIAIDRNVCVCFCRCYQPDDPDDSDYTDDSESESESLPGSDYDIDPRHIRRYGVSMNAVSTNAQSDDRNLWFEGQLHHIAATQHDLGIPAESSLTNSDNRITSVELAALNRPIDPWDVEDIQQSTNMTFEEVGNVFPETRAWLPRLPRPPPSPPSPRITSRTIRGMLDTSVCSHCSRLLSPDMTFAITNNDIFVCRVCASPIRPLHAADDPDWGDFNVNISVDGLRYCYCRCMCDVPTPLELPRRRRIAPNMPRSEYIEMEDEVSDVQVQADNGQSQEPSPRNPDLANAYLEAVEGYLSGGEAVTAVEMAIHAVRADPTIIFRVEDTFVEVLPDRFIRAPYGAIVRRRVSV